jgi:hypothetical protein
MSSQLAAKEAESHKAMLEVAELRSELEISRAASKDLEAQLGLAREVPSMILKR